MRLVYGAAAVNLMLLGFWEMITNLTVNRKCAACAYKCQLDSIKYSFQYMQQCQL